MRLFAGTEWDKPPKCERCDELLESCQCPPEVKPLADPNTQTARLTVEKRKRGKMVTLVRGLAAEENDLSALLTRLKTTCGAGGTVKDEQIEIQGEHLDRLRDALRKMGYRVKF